MKAKRGRPRKQATPHTGFTTRDPMPKTRDPVIQKPKRDYQSRRYIPAPMPVICPRCGRNTRQTGGSYKDPVNQTIVEYRVCVKCGEKLGAGRKMAQFEIDKYCSHSEIVKEYLDK